MPPVTVTSVQVRLFDHEYSVTLDPGDPLNAPPVPALQPVLDADSALIGFTSPEKAASSSQDMPERIGKTPPRSKKQGSNNVQKFNQPPPIRSVAFSIYSDPSCHSTFSLVYYEPPNTVPHTVYNKPIVYPYRGLPQTGRVPLAPLDQPWSKQMSLDENDPGFLDPSFHSTPKPKIMVLPRYVRTSLELLVMMFESQQSAGIH